MSKYIIIADERFMHTTEITQEHIQKAAAYEYIIFDVSDTDDIKCCYGWDKFYSIGSETEYLIKKERTDQESDPEDFD